MHRANLRQPWTPGTAGRRVTVRKFLYLSAAVLSAAAFSVLPGTAAAQAASWPTAHFLPQVPAAGGGDGCNPGRANDYPDSTLFDGWSSDPGGTVGGVYSDIYDYSPWVHYISSTASAVVGWVMVDNTNSFYDWSQVGWLEYPLGARYTFDQTFNGSGTPRTMMFASKPINTYHYYTVLYNNPSGYFSFQVDGSQIDKTRIDFTPNEGENYGEAKSTADQMAGGYNNPEVFKDTHVYYSGGWHAFNGIPNATKNYYWYSELSGYTLEIWDGACAH